MTKKIEEEKERYERIVGEVVSSLSGEKERNAALHLLSSEKAIETYGILRESEIPYTTIKRVMAHSLHNFQRGRGLTIGSYALGLAEELSNSERYGDIVDDMYKDGIISQRQYKDLQGSVIKNIKGRGRQLREGLSHLEKKLGASILGIFGIGLLISSGLKITGNIIGITNANLSGSIAGFVLLLISLILFSRSFKN